MVRSVTLRTWKTVHSEVLRVVCGDAMSNRLPFAFALALASTTAACDIEPSSKAAPEPSKTTVRTECDIEALRSIAHRVTTARAAWTPADGHAFQEADAVAEALMQSCTAEFSSPYLPLLKHMKEDQVSGWPLYDNCRARPSGSVCPDMQSVTETSHRSVASDRASVFYDGCDLERFDAIVSRDEFISIGANSGAVALLALGTELRNMLSEETADALTRELVLASGRRFQLPDAIRLPVAENGAPLGPRPAFLVLTSDGRYTLRATFPIELRPFELDEVSWSLEDWREREAEAAKKGSPTQSWILAADRDVGCSQLRDVLGRFEKEGVEMPKLLVLTADDASPYRTVDAPACSTTSKTLREVVESP